MKYYDIRCLNNAHKTTKIPFKGGSWKAYMFCGKPRINLYDSISIDGYKWNRYLCKWESCNKLTPNCLHSQFYRKGVPYSFKSFNRYVQKLIKEQSFPQGTVIKLTGRFTEIGIFCIL